MSTLSQQPQHTLRPSSSSQSVRNTTSAAASASTSSLQASSSSASRSTLTVETALAQASGNAKLALETVVAERNQLAGQNASLWKVVERVEKQRANYSKDVERLRAERDRALAKLDGLTGEGSSRSLSASSSSAKIRTSPSTQVKSASVDDNEPTPTRPRALCHQSEGSDHRSASPRSRSNEGTNGNHQDSLSRSGSVPALLFSSGLGDVTPSQSRPTPTRHTSEPAESSRQPATVGTSIPVPQLNLTSPQSGAITTPASGLAQPLPVPLETSPTDAPGSEGSTSSLSPSTPPSSSFQPRARATARESRITLPDEATRYIAAMVDSPLPSPRGATYAFSPSQLATTPSITSSETMGNGTSRTRSPLAVDPEPSTATELVFKDIAVNEPEETHELPPHRTRSPVEDMDAESIISVSSKRSPAKDPVVEASPFDDVAEVPEDQPTGEDSETEDLSQAALAAPPAIRIPQPVPTTQEPPIDARPPGPPRESPERSAHSSGSGGWSQPSLMVSVAESAAAKSSSGTSLRTGSLEPPPESPSDGSLSQSSSRGYSTQQPPQVQLQAPIPGQAPGHVSYPPPASSSNSQAPKFRSTRLTVTDLPYTKVKIHSSNIKTNDRGREVLSFSFTIFPAGDGEVPTNPTRKNPNGPGPESWLIEKLYSEIIALDGNIRNKLGRSGSKKLAPLPDGKLFKDHAPAKVDARKAILETFMRSLIALPLKDKTEICMFLSTDVVRGSAVMNADHKEGYLTKRGKNFGGWKTRYFVLQSSVLEYYENRGGQHLGSININGAQIGRQQRNNVGSRESDDENSYRHAFLIIEAKKGPGGASVRHVLCAESDEERDAWVELLVKYVVAGQNGNAPKTSMAFEDEPRASTSTAEAIPASRVAADPQYRWANAQGQSKPSLDSVSESASIASSMTGPNVAPTDTQIARRLLERGPAQPVDVPLSSSLPSSLDQSGLADTQAFNPPPRANSELGHYPDLSGNSSDQRSSPNGLAPTQSRKERASFHPSHALKSSTASVPPPGDRAASPDKPSGGKIKISGPLNGAPIPAGAKFEGVVAARERDSNERREKAKSGRFWGFGRPAGGPGQGGLVPRAVFGVPLDVSLTVAKIADLPAVVFRCVEYLEAKHAELEEGIYRLSGSSNVIKGLKERFNNEGDVNLLKSESDADPHAIAGLLKTFLRDLPSSILTRELHLRFLGVIDFANQQERIDELASLISQLPVPNYCLLRALCAHLILIVQHAHINKMTMRNVGIVFSPTLGIPAGVFGLMLGEFEKVFNVDGNGDDETPEPDVGEEPALDEGYLSNRNSRSYADGAADKLLGLAGRKLGATEEESDDAEDEIVAESSETETEDTENTSPPDTPGPSTYLRSEATVVPDATQTPRNAIPHSAANIAASRGLQVNVPAASAMNGRRTSGLPTSPRPNGRSGHPTGSGSPLTATLSSTR